jgi:hypothetical protein
MGEVVDTHQQFRVARDPTPVPTSALLRDVYPAAGPALAGKPELGWDSPPDAKLCSGVLADARGRALGINSPALTRSGALYVGARFGQVQMRPALGAPWRSLVTGTIHEIMAVLPLDDGRLLAGGEEGLLALSVDQGRSWKRLTVAPPGTTVVFLGAAPDGTIFSSQRPRTSSGSMRRRSRAGCGAMSGAFPTRWRASGCGAAR